MKLYKYKINLVIFLIFPVVIFSFFFFLIDFSFNIFLLHSDFLFIDGVSLYFLFMTTWTTLFCGIFLMLNISICFTEFLSFSFCLIFIEFLITLAFLTSDVFWFFIFFEACLFPIFLLIICFGSKERRTYAGFMISIYTLVGSIGLFYTISYLESAFGTMDLFILRGKLSYLEQLILWWGFFIPLAIKIPMYPFHLWLPEAHVEAPTEVSVILAAILLKIGGYGFIRFLWPIFFFGCKVFAPFVIGLSFFGLLCSSITSLYLIDLKRIIAYSSIAHMNLCVIGIFSGEASGLTGSLFLMLSHGFTSAGLFVLVGMFYRRVGSRSLSYFGGCGFFMPKWIAFFYIFSLINSGLPGTMNFVGELLIFISLSNYSFPCGLEVLISIVLSIFYSLRPASLISSGTLKAKNNFIFEDLTKTEFIFIFSYFIILVFFGLLSSFYCNIISVAVVSWL